MPHTHDRVTPPAPGGGGVLLGLWRVTDPKITLASAASMFLGAAVAGAHGPIAWGWLGATVAGILFLEAAKNASGEIFDWDSGADTGLTDAERTPFSGGKRVLWFGLAGVGLAYFYQAPPFRLSYRGLGEAAVALAYGPLIDEPVRWVPSQAATLVSFVLLALGAGAGFLFGGS